MRRFGFAGITWLAASVACVASDPILPAPRPPALSGPRAPALSTASAPLPSADPTIEASAPAVPEGSASADPGPAPSVASVASVASSGPPGPRLTSRGYQVFVWRQPNRDTQYIGMIRHGQSVALKSKDPVPGTNCPGPYYAIEPRGYVCADRQVTLTPSKRFVDAARATEFESAPLPYKYAISNNAPMYNRVPTPDEQVRNERPLGPAGKWTPLPKTLSAHEDLAVTTPIAAKDEIPWFFKDKQPADGERFGLVRQTIPVGSMLSFTKAFEAEGRTWLLSVDQTLVPADRVRLFRPSEHKGTVLGQGVDLPIAWMRKTAKTKYRLGKDDTMSATTATWPVRSFVRLTGKKKEAGGKTYWETRENDPDADAAPGSHLFIADADATVVEARDKLGFAVQPGQKWIHVSILNGTLVAYEDLKPVYATLMSPGAGGVPRPGVDNVKASTTPTGTYNITFKDRAATMSPETGLNRSFWIADVPYTQYFNAPFALHVAFWHERFGEPTSAGCVNVSPIDGKWLFDWSDPKLPEGWQGITGAGATSANGPTTAVVVGR